MINSDMYNDRILKLQKGKRMFSDITNHLKRNGVVLVCTYTHATKLTAKHIDMVKLGKTGDVYLQAGKKWNCINGCGIRFQ